MPAQKTVARDIVLQGVGVHSGRPVTLQLLPSDAGTIVFRRTDLEGAEMGLHPDRVESRNSTALMGDRFRVQTIEHLLAALYAFGVESLVAALDADEMPILDGSALPFVRALREAGLREIPAASRPARIAARLTVGDDEAWVRFDPPAAGEDGLLLDYAIAYGHPAIGTEQRAVLLSPGRFEAEIAPARTFGFFKDVEALHRQGLALGSSLDNTVVLSEEGIVNPPLRFPDEFVRHKLLDLTGDLALLGRPLLGRVSAHKAGHRLHLEAVRGLLASPSFLAGFDPPPVLG